MKKPEPEESEQGHELRNVATAVASGPQGFRNKSPDEQFAALEAKWCGRRAAPGHFTKNFGSKAMRRSAGRRASTSKPRCRPDKNADRWRHERVGDSERAGRHDDLPQSAVAAQRPRAAVRPPAGRADGLRTVPELGFIGSDTFILLHVAGAPAGDVRRKRSSIDRSISVTAACRPFEAP